MSGWLMPDGVQCWLSAGEEEARAQPVGRPQQSQAEKTATNESERRIQIAREEVDAASEDVRQRP